MATVTRDYVDREITLGGKRFHYLDWGATSKQTMLLLHGGGQDAHSWDEFSQAMRGDYHVIALDQRGHGDSDWSKRHIYTARAMAQDVTRFVGNLGMDGIILIGLSMGGRNSIVYAAMHPEKLARLVIVEMGPETMKKGSENIRQFRKDDILPSFDAFVERAHKFNPRRPIEQLRERLQHHLRQLPDGRWTWKTDQAIYGRERDARQHEDLWPYVRRIKTPMLLVRGAESDLLAQDAAERFQQAVPGSRLVVIPRAGHTVPGDNPPAFAATVRDYLINVNR